MESIVKELFEMQRQWTLDKATLRFLATGVSIPAFYNVANLLNEAEIALQKAILEASAKTS